jgi:hypothetical protein
MHALTRELSTLNTQRSSPPKYCRCVRTSHRPSDQRHQRYETSQVPGTIHLPYARCQHTALLQCSDATVYVHLIIANSQPLAFASLKPNQPGQVRARQAGALQDHHDTSALTKLQSGARPDRPRIRSQPASSPGHRQAHDDARCPCSAGMGWSASGPPPPPRAAATRGRPPSAGAALASRSAPRRARERASERRGAGRGRARELVGEVWSTSAGWCGPR